MQHPPSNTARPGFSLIELAMALVISGLMLGFILKAPGSNVNAGGVSGGDGGSYACTKAQMVVIRDAIEAFARKNDRLPVPADRTLKSDDTAYGREAGFGMTFGALPFQALGLSPALAGDCWGNKFTYKVTSALTSSNVTTGYPNIGVNGTITLKSTLANNINTNTAYAVISHGEDGLGALKLNQTSGTSLCAGGTLREVNCSNTNVVADAVFNNGKDAGANYFDDLIIASVKSPYSSTVYKTYLWGQNTHGQQNRGDTLAANRNTTPALMTPVGGSYTAIGAGTSNGCAISTDGNAYCWGTNANGQHGCGACGTHGYVAANPVTKPIGVNAWTQISVGEYIVCAIADDTKTYCWGDNQGYSLGNGVTNSSTPLEVTKPAAISYFSQVVTGSTTACGLADTGDAYCWGRGTEGQIGDSSTSSRNTPTQVIIPGGVKLTKITNGGMSSCALGVNGRVYCWGQNTFGTTGNGTTGASTALPAAALLTAGTFVDIASGLNFNCALYGDGNAWCWGQNAQGEHGNGLLGTSSSTPVAVTLLPGVTFTRLWTGSPNQTACAIGTDGLIYCWGRGDEGQMGNGTTSPSTTPTPVILGGVTWDHVIMGAAHVTGLTSNP